MGLQATCSFYYGFDTSQFWNNNTGGSMIACDSLHGYVWIVPVHSGQTVIKIDCTSIFNTGIVNVSGVSAAKVLYSAYTNSYVYPHLLIGINKLWLLGYEQWDGLIVKTTSSPLSVYSLYSGCYINGMTCVDCFVYLSINDPNNLYGTGQKYFIIVLKITSLNENGNISFTFTFIQYITNYIDKTNSPFTNKYSFTYIGCLTYCSNYDSSGIFAIVTTGSINNIIKLDTSNIH